MNGRGRDVAVSDDGLVLWDSGRVAHFAVTTTRDAGGPASIHPGDLVTVVDGVIHRIAAGVRAEWPPSADAPGHDLARLSPDRWSKLTQRARLTAGVRKWFDAQGFLEVDTPLVVPSPGTEVHLDPVAVTLSDGPGRPPETRWLITSPEYAMKRLLAAGAPSIYQICKVFRDGERGGNHRPEFTMLEWYRPWVDGYDVLMADCESLMTSLAGDTLTWRGQRYDLRPPWPRHTFHELLRERADIADPYALSADQQLFAWVDRVEKTLGLDHPEFVIEWPIALASLSRM